MHWRIFNEELLAMVWFWCGSLYYTGNSRLERAFGPMNSDAGRQECHDFRPYHHAT
jgi:hypothetical protein